MSGWIKLYRDLNKHWIWDNSDYLKWWLDILLEVNHADAKVIIKNKIYECKRGEKLYSLDTWATRWKTNKSKVRRFFELLQKDSMIELKNETQTTRLIVCKYEDYQEKENAFETQPKRKRNANETHLTPIQEEKERKEEKENNIEPINWHVLLDFFNKTTGKKCKLVSDKAKKQFNARLKDKYTKQDIANAIINVCNNQYHIDSNLEHVTLEFISRPDKFEKYSQIKNNLNNGTTNQKLMKYDDSGQLL
jgi:uncharacterized phage protein (TIGR02220 family)